MSTVHGQPGLSSEQRSTIRSTILSTRHTLESELRRQLEKYGIYENETLPLSSLTHLSTEERHTRRTLDAVIEREVESTGDDLERSITNYVREATRSYLNRFVALKTIEVRGLVEETLTERPQYGGRSYMHYTVAEIAGELTSAPDDGFGAALDLAHQEIGAEIQLLFEDSEHTAITLDAQVRKEVLDELETIGDEAWQSDEALGWVYQYFVEEARNDLDKRISAENYKLSGTEIATKTQLFTPRYIVEWMVDNSLGRLWLESQGERTSIDDEDQCSYLAPVEESLIHRQRTSVEEITVLDPACGSGHLLFYAFDVLYQMYVEEGEVPEKYIPREILRNNLYGIDIDSGAAQIAALSLYLKAKEKAPAVSIPRLNIVSADAVLVDDGHKQELLSRARSELEADVLEQLWDSFANVREFGSLVRVEEQIDRLLNERRETLQESGQGDSTAARSSTTKDACVSREGGEESWSQMKTRLRNAVSDIASEAVTRNDPVEELFAGEVEKSVELLDLLVGQYDVVVSNPPYLNSSKMSARLKEFTRSNYYGYRDLYACFLERVSELTAPSGYTVTITPETFMYLRSFEDLRSHLLDSTTMIESAHLTNRDEDYMNVCHLSVPGRELEVPAIKFTRVVGLDDKEAGVEEIVSAYRDTRRSERIFELPQSTFAGIRGSPFAYWYGEEVLAIFEESRHFDRVVDIESGVKTGNNDAFLRKAWEVSPSERGSRYRASIRSENSRPYHDETTYLLDWKDEGAYIQAAGDEHGNQYFFGDESRVGEECVAFQKNSKYFLARYVKAREIPDNQMYRVHADSVSIPYVNGWMNSALVRYVIEGFNPSANFQKYDVERLPFKQGPDARSVIEPLHTLILEKVDEKSALLEETLQFSHTHFASVLGTDCREGMANIWAKLMEAEAARMVAGGVIDENVMDVYGVSEETRRRIYSEILPNPSRYPHVANSGQIPHERVRAEIETVRFDDEAYRSLVATVAEASSGTLRELSTRLEVSPYTIINVVLNEDEVSVPEVEEVTGRVVSYLLGQLLDRWEQTEQSPIFVFERDTDKADSRIDRLLEDQFTEPNKARNRIESALGRSLEQWLQNRFFRYHHANDYKRRSQRIPVYWQLESQAGAFSCYLYYHGITRNTLPKLRGQCLDPRIEKLENELEMLSAQVEGSSPDREVDDALEHVRTELADVRDFRETVDEMINAEVTVDTEDGVWENIKEWDSYEVLQTGLPTLKPTYSRPE